MEAIGSSFFNDIQLEIGTIATSFEPYNPQYAHAPIKLASNVDRTIADSYDSATGQVFRRLVTDAKVDGALPWVFSTDFVGYKSVYTTGYTHPLGTSTYAVIAKYDGAILAKDTAILATAMTGANKFIVSSTSTVLSIADADSGWGEDYTPSSAEIRHYFNGWKMNNGVLGTLYDSGTKYWTPIISQKANFVGKVAGRLIENPHIFRYSVSSDTLISGPTGGVEDGTTQVERISKLDGTITPAQTSTNGRIAQQKFSFDLIEHVIRNYGAEVFGSNVTIADRIAWLKVNLSKMSAKWHGYGSGPNGNKAIFTPWNVSTGAWSPGATGTQSSVAFLALSDTSGIPVRIDDNGFVHFLAYAEASNGTVSSVVNTDYVELELDLNLTAIPIGHIIKTYTPYTMDCVRATPITETLTVDLGALSMIEGGNTVELMEGVIVREKFIPKLDNTAYYVQSAEESSFWGTSRVSLRTRQFLNVYKGNVRDDRWSFSSDRVWAVANANRYAPGEVESSDWYVDYIVLDKFLYTTNAVDATLTYQSTQGSVIAQNVQDIAAIKTHDGVQDWILAQYASRLLALEEA